MTAILADLVAARRRSPFTRCEWCGWPCYGRSCSAHRDLTQLQHANQSPPRIDMAVTSGTGFDNHGG